MENGKVNSWLHLDEHRVERTTGKVHLNPSTITFFSFEKKDAFNNNDFPNDKSN